MFGLLGGPTVGLKRGQLAGKDIRENKAWDCVSLQIWKNDYSKRLNVFLLILAKWRAFLYFSQVYEGQKSIRCVLYLWF